MNRRGGFTLVELMITLVSVGMVVVVIAGIVVALVLGTKGCKHVQEKGIKNIAESVWEGSENAETDVVDVVEAEVEEIDNEQQK
jgi:Tfp pilus assembly major pilin PilA